MTHPVGRADEASLNVLAQQLLRVIATAGYVPGRRPRTLDAMRKLLRQLADAVAAEPFDPDQGWPAGARLVELRMADPRVLGATDRLLTERLPSLFTGDPVTVADRVAQVLEQMVNGFTAALRDTAMRAGDDMNRTMRKTWAAERSELEFKLQRARLQDPVTRLPNSSHLRERLRWLLGTEDRRQRLGMCLLNVDDFADLNDALGHGHGDDVLRAVGRRLTELVRGRMVAARSRRAESGEGDSRCLLAHLGGEKFVLVVTGTDGPDEMIKVAEQARQALWTVALPSVDGYELRLRASAGVVEGTIGSRGDPGEWVTDVHRALAWAHEDQQGTVAFDARRAEDDINRHRMAAAVPVALERDEFEAFFQPIMAIKEHRMAGVEALARWRRPGAGLVNPMDFITSAEKTGLVVPLDRAILEKACRQGAVWRAAGHDLLISVNVSARNLGEPGLAAAVAAALDRTGLPPDRLQLEITESAPVADHLGVLRELDDMDVRLALDDYGVGFANLAAVSKLPVTTVKLAAELVRGLEQPDDAAAYAVVDHTIQVCHKLNISVIAEGIETETQYRQLRRMGCDYGQGYLLGRPAPADVVTRRL